jgi:uncharacterized protein (TIGR02246 family)
MGSDEQAIREVVNTWLRATADGDVSSVLRLMAEDVVFLVPGHPPMRGRHAFEQGLRALLQQHKIELRSEIQEIQISGDLAYCWSHLSVVVTPLAHGSPNRRAGYTLTIFRRQPDGAWVVFRDANLLTAAPAVDPDR